jgi:dTMP kinase
MSDTQITKEYLSKFRAPGFPGSYLLSFEGIEGAGKSTQIVKARDYLEKLGFRVLILREPGGTSFGEKLREAILNHNKALHPVAEVHLFAASRAQLLEEVTLRELSVAGTVIILDRYIDSTLAYQGKARGLGMKYVLDIHNIFPLNLVPHLTLYLKISLQTSMQRQKIRNAPKDYFERQGEDFYQNLIKGYDEAADLFPDRIKTINAEVSFEQVEIDIKSSLDELINQRPQ